MRSAVNILGAGAGVHPSANNAGCDERRGLGAMNIFERSQIGLFVLGFEIHDLAANHAVDCAGGMRDLADDWQPAPGPDN